MNKSTWRYGSDDVRRMFSSLAYKWGVGVLHFSTVIAFSRHLHTFSKVWRGKFAFKDKTSICKYENKISWLVNGKRVGRGRGEGLVVVVVSVSSCLNLISLDQIKIRYSIRSSVFDMSHLSAHLRNWAEVHIHMYIMHICWVIAKLKIECPVLLLKRGALIKYKTKIQVKLIL